MTKIMPARVLAATFLLLGLPGCAGMAAVPAIGALSGNLVPTASPLTLQPSELRIMQSRVLPIAKGAAFAAVMAVLMDEGFRIESANLDTGLIIAEASGHDKVRFDFRGMVVAREAKRAQIWIDEHLDGSSVRASFGKRSSATGATGTIEVPILDASDYQSFFARLEREAADRNPIAMVEELASPHDDVFPETEVQS
jgi:hypothetical protein